nr:PTS sugar transporter subunit IIA [Sebaldella sp. S0638]
MVILNHEPFQSKEKMFDILSEKFEKSGIVSDACAFKHSLEHRETLGSTYMGNLIALPHGRCKEVLKPGMAFCRCSDIFPYESYNEKGDVRYIFMLAISENDTSNNYLRMLAKLAGLLAKDEFVNSLDSVNDHHELMNLIENTSTDD